MPSVQAAAHTLLGVSSLGWPVAALCALLSVSVLPVLALFALKNWGDDAEDSWEATAASVAATWRKRVFLPRLWKAVGNRGRGGIVARGKEGSVVVWQFPPKEDRAERHRRWADVLRFKPREARLPVAPLLPPREFSVGIALEAFAQGEEERELLRMLKSRTAAAADGSPPRGGALGAPFPGRPKAAVPVDHHAAVADGVAASLLGSLLGARGQHSSGPVPGPVRPGLSPSVQRAAWTLKEKVKARILRFLIESGPPKGLTTIAEDTPGACLGLLGAKDDKARQQQLWQHKQKQRQTSGHGVVCAVVVEGDCSTPWVAPPVVAAEAEGPGPAESAGPAVGGHWPELQSSPRTKAASCLAAAAALDGEAVLRTRSGEGVSRELLWAALANIDALTGMLPQAPLQRGRHVEAGRQGQGVDASCV